MNNLPLIALTSTVVVVMLVTIGMILSRLYRRASKEISFVRTGFGGQKVIMNGGSLVFPVLHETIPVNMNTLRLEVRRANEQALITRDRMRVDVEAEFYVRVKPTEEAIADAAQTLGRKTLSPAELKSLVEGKFVDSLRSVAAEMTMEDLHEQRVDFVQKVQTAVTEDLLKNGLELETVSLTGLDQTAKEFFNPNNAFDAQGLTHLTEEVENRRKERNDIEQDTEVAIRQKNLGAEQQKLEIAKDEEYARLQQEREVEIRRASQLTEIARERAEQSRAAEEARIASKREIDTAAIEAHQSVEEQRVLTEQMIRQREIDKSKAVELAHQDEKIAVALKSKEQSEAEALADAARALAVKAEEEVYTVREVERADRQKQIELVEASKEAEREAIRITVAATAEKHASEDQAEALRVLAQGEADKIRLAAEGDADAEKLRAAAAEISFAVEAAGKRALNEAANILSSEQISMQVKLQIVENLAGIIHESVRPMDNIDAIKIFQVDGLTKGAGVPGDGNGSSATTGSGNLAEQVVNSALQYRAQQPLVDGLMSELGFSGGDVDGLTSVLTKAVTSPTNGEAKANGSTVTPEAK